MSTKEQKIEWLIAHADLWAYQFIDRENLSDLRETLCRGMKDDGLVSYQTSSHELGIHSMMRTAIERMKQSAST